MKQIQQSLFPSMPLPKAVPVLRRRVMRPALKRRVPLWLAIHLPRLPLAAVSAGNEKRVTAQAVIESCRGGACIVTVNDPAASHGVSPGMTLAAAWALLPSLDVHERDPEKERQLLQRLATWANRYSPFACIDEQSVLLEVRASLQMFGGAAALHDTVNHALQGFELECSIAMAPTPRAASWLARAGRNIHVDRPDALPAALARLPVSVTGFEAVLLEKLQGIGVRHIGDLLRLPRDGFARRYGRRKLRELDQALGRAPDVRRPLPAPKRFSTRFDLSYEISETDRLLHPIAQMLTALDDYLQSTQQGISRLQLRLLHRDGTFTPVMLGFAGTTRDAARIRDLLEQKLETVTLPAPVLELVLQAEELAAMTAGDRALFIEDQSDNDGWPQLVERLRTRLGVEAVNGIEQQADHRPERAWRFVPPGSARHPAGGDSAMAARPHWLLELPQPLGVQAGNPCSDGPLEILDGPERIETGWWDDADISRDYFVAGDRHGRRLWIYRDVKTGEWWWQGIFE